MLDATDITKTYAHNGRTVRAVANIDVRVDAGEFLALCGPSGCGKTTLLMILGGLLAPDTGVVSLDGEDIYACRTERRGQLRGRKIGFVFQQFHLIPYLSVLDNVRAPALACPGVDLGDPATELIHRFGLTDRIDHVPAALSTGQRQRVALARAMVANPGVLLADEPTGNLDEANSQLILDCLTQYAQSGGAVVMVTHDRAAAARAQRMLTMDRGSQ